MANIDNVEEPLAGTPLKYRKWRKTNSLEGPKKAIKLCLLGIVLPGLLISIPIYLRYRVYDPQLYPLGMSDMRLIDGRVSTTWCQKQVVRSNATFNAFLMSETPNVSKNHVHVSMTRHLMLDDDMKEYWGFYLLKGSTVTVSTCSRWPGASLIVIRGHRHLHECAYIGDDSSEELAELQQIRQEADENPSNRVEVLKKHRPDVTFHDPVAIKNSANYSLKANKKQELDDSEISAKDMQELLGKIFLKADKSRSNFSRIVHDLHTNKKELGEEEDTDHIGNLDKTKKEEVEKIKNHIHRHRGPDFGYAEEKNIKFAEKIEEIKAAVAASSASGQTSTEIFEEVIKKLQQLGPRGSKALDELRKELLLKLGDQMSNDEVRQALGENDKQFDRKIYEHNSDEDHLRRRRDLILRTASELNQDDEDENLAIEEGFTPDEHADHHHVINETTLNDKSGSEFWSSFSSSEEALLNCAGLIISLPLTPHRHCERQKKDSDLNLASLPNTITYSVPINGYYFFVFNSENEVQQNYIRVNFDIKKTVYNVSHPLAKCSNTTEQCSLPLDFFTNEKVVLELPVKNDNTLWNQEYIVISECEPRTAIYLFCVLTVPLLIIFFALH